jgi:hypothetical protein
MRLRAHGVAHRWGKTELLCCPRPTYIRYEDEAVMSSPCTVQNTKNRKWKRRAPRSSRKHIHLISIQLAPPLWSGLTLCKAFMYNKVINGL